MNRTSVPDIVGLVRIDPSDGQHPPLGGVRSGCPVSPGGPGDGLVSANYDAQTEAGGAQVEQTFAPEECTETLRELGAFFSTVTALSGDETPSKELPAHGPLVPDARRDTTGRVGKGNTLALKGGQYSRALQEDAAPWREAQIAAITADLGDDASTLKRHTVEQLGTVLVILRFLGGNLMADGPLTGKGKQRAATTAYLQTVDRFMRLASTLGLERHTRSVTNPVDWIEGKG
jgi:hypothetical protein